MNLTIPFDPAGLDPKVVSAFDDLIASLQTWANSQKLERDGYATFTQPRCRYYLSAAQSIANNTDTAVLWSGPASSNVEPVFQTVQYDNGASFAGGAFVKTTSADTLRAPVPGQYLVIASAAYAANATGRRELWLQQVAPDGSRIDVAAVSNLSTTAAAFSKLQVCAVLTLDPTQTVGTGVRVMTYQNSGGALNLEYGWSTTFVQMIKLS